MIRFYIFLLAMVSSVSLCAQVCDIDITEGAEQYFQGNANFAYFSATPGINFSPNPPAYFMGYEDSISGPISTVFTQNLWLAYEDEGEIGLAANSYDPTPAITNGFFPGPILADQTTNPDDCFNFNRAWTVRRTDVEAHLADFADNQQIDNPIPSVMGWPGRQNPDFATYNDFTLPANTNDLAPFFDVNQNGIYDPSNGDYPVEPKDLLVADQLTWTVSNTIAGGEATAEGTEIFPLEIQQIVWSFSCTESTLLNDAMFLRYRFTYLGGAPVANVKLGLWQDFDLGCFTDDLIGSIPEMNTVYAYNEDNSDGGEDGICFQGVASAAENPPVQSVTILNQEVSSINYLNGSGGAPPAETMGPNNASEYLNYLNGLWRDGTPMRTSGDGYDEDSNNPITRFAFLGNPNNSQTWSAFSAGLTGTDRRALTTVGRPKLEPGEVTIVDVGYLYHREPDSTHLGNVNAMYERVPQLQALYDNGGIGSACSPESCVEITDDCVWAGDLNDDGIANYVDLVALSFGFSETGPQRPGPSIWAPRNGEAWDFPQAIGPAAKHLDGNGDGVVDRLDYEVTLDHYNLLRPGVFPSPDFVVDGPDLRIMDDPSLDTFINVDPGEFIPMRIRLTTPIEGIAGLSYEFTFDTSFFESYLVTGVDNAPENLRYFREVKPGEYEGVAYREVTFDVNGAEQVLNVILFMKDQPIADFPALQTPINFKNVRAWLADGAEISIGARTTILSLEEPSRISSRPAWAADISIFPNPVGDRLWVDYGDAPVQQLEIFDAQGRLVKTTAEVASIDVSQLPSGTYFLRLSGAAAMTVKRFVKQ